MSGPEDRDEQWSESEQRALDVWTAPEPPADFAERVLARAGVVEDTSSPEPTRLARLWERRGLVFVAAVAASMLIAFGVDLARKSTIEERAEAHFKARTTVKLGRRAVAVGEAGSELRWNIDAAGGAELEQPSGNVFYRVERGGPFVVHTPAGDVRVTGTCFRVEVEQMKSSSAGLIGAGVGAALTATVLVTVYEGSVVTASTQGEVAIGAGEAARLDPGSAPKKTLARLGSGPSAREEGAFAAGGDVPVKPLPEGLSAGELYVAHAKLAKEAEALRGELKELRAKLDEAGGPSRHKIWDIDPAELQQMAQRCELRWDMQSLRAEPDTLGKKDAEKLELTDDEREVIDKALRANHERLVKELRAIYVEVTGDNTSGSMAPMSMFEEINDKAPEGEIQRVFQRLARERAGLQPPPVDLTGTTAYERLYRLMTTAGDSLEAGVARELGPDVARAYRSLHGGFGSKSRSSNGCPKESAPAE